MKKLTMILCLSLICGFVANGAVAQEWGDLTATFVLDGDVPAADKVQVTKDAEFCGKFNLVDESLVVNPENKGIANVIVYMYLRTGSPPIHESYEDTASEKILLDNAQCRFNPHVVLLRTSQTLTIGNSDPLGHNSKIDTFTNPPTNYTIPAGAKIDQQFAEEERLPCKVSCSIHPWMDAWLVVKDNPYMGVSDENGKLVIKNIPAGEWTFQFWQEKAGYLDEVKQDGSAVDWTRGRVDIEIKPGTNDLGEISVPVSAFAD